MPAMDTVTPDNPACVINCVHYDDQGKRHDISLDAISDVIASDNGFVWVGLYEPDDSVLLKLQEEFGLHSLAIEDARNAHQRPKVEAYGNSLFVVVTTAQMVDERIRYGETHGFLGPRFLVTVRHGASLSYAAPRARVEREPELLRTMGPSYCLYAVLDFVVDNYLPITQRYRDTLELLEKDIFSDNYKRHTVVRLYELKRELNKMRMAVAPLQDMLSQIKRYQGDLVPDEVKLYLRDVHDHAVRISDVIDTLREMLGTALSVNLSLVTLAQGETVKRLGAWAALLAAPTLITSWYGMNFTHMPELDKPWAYPAMIIGVGAVCVGLYRLFKRARWL